MLVHVVHGSILHGRGSVPDTVFSPSGSNIATYAWASNDNGSNGAYSYSSSGIVASCEHAVELREALSACCRACVSLTVDVSAR